MDPASALGVAGSAVAVIDFGIKLGLSLATYVETVANADERVRQISSEVNSVASALEQLQQIVDQDKADPSNAILSPRGVRDIENEREQCYKVFLQIVRTLNKAGKPVNGPSRDDRAEILALSNLDHIKWPLLSQKIRRFQLNLESRKTTLFLLLQVANLAYLRRRDSPTTSLPEREIRKVVRVLATKRTLSPRKPQLSSSEDELAYGESKPGRSSPKFLTSRTIEDSSSNSRDLVGGNKSGAAKAYHLPVSRNPIMELTNLRPPTEAPKKLWWKRITSQKPKDQPKQHILPLEAYLLAVPRVFPLHLSPQLIEQEIMHISAPPHSLEEAVSTLTVDERELVSSIRDRMREDGADFKIMALRPGYQGDSLPPAIADDERHARTLLLFLLKRSLVARPHKERMSLRSTPTKGQTSAKPEPPARQTASRFPHEVTYFPASDLSDDNMLSREDYDELPDSHLIGQMEYYSNSSHAQTARPIDLGAYEPRRMAMDTPSGIPIDPTDMLLARWTTAFGAPSGTGDNDAKGAARGQDGRTERTRHTSELGETEFDPGAFVAA